MEVSIIIVAVRYDKNKGGFVGWLTKTIPETSDELKKLFAYVETGFKPPKDLGWDDILDANNIKDYREEFKAFMQDTEYGEKTLDNFNTYLKANTHGLNMMQRAGRAASTAIKTLAGAAASMAIMWAIGEVIGLVVEGLDNLILTSDEAKEALEGAVSSFEETANNLQSLNDELETTNDRIKELQALADDGTISIADEDELELLKEQNEQLERRIALQETAKINAAEEVLSSARDVMRTKGGADFIVGTFTGGVDTIAELKAQRAELEKLQDLEKYTGETRINEMGEWIGREIYESELGMLDAQIEYASEPFEHLIPTVNSVVDAYETLINMGVRLTDEQQEEYDYVRSAQQAYLGYSYSIAQTEAAFRALSDSQKRAALQEKLMAKGLSETTSKYVVNSIASDDLDDYYNVGVNFVVPEMSEYDEFTEWGKACAEAWLNGVEEISNLESEEPELFATLSEAQSEAIKNYQDALESISGVYENVEDYDITKLTQTFGDYDWSAYISGAETLDAAMQKIASQSLQSVLDQFEGFTGCEKILDELKESLDEIINTDFDLSKNIEAYEELSDAVEKSRNNYKFTEEEITKLIMTYPELASNIKVVGDAYEIEQSALVNLANQYVDSANASIAANNQKTKDVMEATKARIEMYKQEAEAMQMLLTSYVTGSDYRSGSYNASEQGQLLKYGTSDFDRVIAQMEEEYNTRFSYLEKLSYLETIEDTSASSSSSSSSLQEIDWMANSLNNLQTAVDELEQTFENTKGIENQKKALAELNEGIQALRDSYYSTSDNSDTAYGAYSQRYSEALASLGSSSSSIKSKIEANDVFDLSEFDSDTAKIINDAIDAWKGMSDAKNQYIELGVQLDENAVQALQLDLDHVNELMDMTNSKLDGSIISDEKRVGLFDKLTSQTKEYYNLAISIAKLEGNSTEVSALRIQRAQELAAIEQQRLELAREQSEAEISNIEAQIRAAESTIDLNGGNASASDYGNLLDLNNQKLKEQNEQYEEELALLNEIRESTGENSSEYREQKSRVDDIADAIADCKQNTKDWTVALLELPLAEIENTLDNLNDRLEGVQDRLENIDQVIAGAQAYIQQEIDAQEELKNVVQEQLDSMQSSNDERERALALQKAQYELERAWNQRSVKLYREGEGFVYESSQTAIRDAQESYDSAQYDIAIAALEKQLDYYDDIIADLQEVQDKWSNVASKAQDVLDIQEAIAQLGVDGIMSGATADNYVGIYTQLLKEQSSLEESIMTMEDLQERIEDIVAMYNSGLIDAQQATEQLRIALTGFYGEFDSATGESTEAKIQAIIDRIKEFNGIQATLDETQAKIRSLLDAFGEGGYQNVDEFAQKIAEVIAQFYELEEVGNVSAITDWLNHVKEIGGSDLIDTEALQSVIDLYRQTLDTASDTKEAANTVDEASKQAIAAIGEEKAAVDEGTEAIATGSASAGESLESLAQKIEMLMQKMDELAQSTFIADFATSQLPVVNDFTNSVEQSFTGMAQNVVSSFSTMFNSLQQQMNSVSTQAANLASSVNSTISTANQQLANLQSTAASVASSVASSAKTSSSSVKNVSSGKFTMVQYHDGLKNGLVGEKSAKTLQTLALDKINPDEIPAILQVDEAVLTELQQSNILSNMKSSYMAGLRSVESSSGNESLTVETGDIYITEAGDAKEVVDCIVRELKPSLKQYLNRR